MSWMDSWSRPSKQAKFPPPLYLTEGGDQVPYCHTCGRVISARRGSTSASHSSPVKYCSERCRRSKPGAKDRQIEDAFVALLIGDQQEYTQKYMTNANDAGPLKAKNKVKMAKGESRLIVWCSDVETLVFGSRFDPEKTAGRKKNRTPRGVPDVGEWKSVDMEDKPANMNEEENGEESDQSENIDELDIDLSLGHPEVDRDHIYFGAGKRRPSQSKAEVNGSVGGEKGWAEKIEETDEMLQKRHEGQKRADEKEMVRRAARRGVAFGFSVPHIASSATIGSQHSKHKHSAKVDRNKGRKDDGVEDELESSNDPRKKCEAVITKAAVVVEPSFAKGNWGIRWRENV